MVHFLIWKVEVTKGTVAHYCMIIGASQEGQGLATHVHTPLTTQSQRLQAENFISFSHPVKLLIAHMYLGSCGEVLGFG